MVTLYLLVAVGLEPVYNNRISQCIFCVTCDSDGRECDSEVGGGAIKRLWNSSVTASSNGAGHSVFESGGKQMLTFEEGKAGFNKMRS